MNNDDRRLDEFLGGERPFEDLPEAVQSEEVRLRELLGTLRDDALAPATLRSDVMKRVSETPIPLWRRLFDTWVRPRTIRLSPAMATVAVAALAAVLIVRPTSTPIVEAPPQVTAEGVVTRFVLVAPEASSVHITGDFASWSSEGIELEDLRGSGVWTTDVPLPPGVYQYTFIIDGSEWRPDPLALSQVDDGFGQVNSVVIVSPESAA